MVEIWASSICGKYSNNMIYLKRKFKIQGKFKRLRNNVFLEIWWIREESSKIYLFENLCLLFLPSNSCRHVFLCTVGIKVSNKVSP